MALTLGDGLFGLTILSGLVLCLLGVYCYRRWDEPGVAAFAGMTVMLGVGSLAGSLLGVAQGLPVPDETVPLWANVSLVGWGLAMVPWILFGLTYTGRYTRIRWRTVGIIAIPAFGFFPIVAAQYTGSAGTRVLLSFLGTLSVLYVFALAIVGGYLLLRTTYEYGHLSVSQGLCLTTAGILPLVMLNSIGILLDGTGNTVIFTVYALAFVVPTVALLLAVFRYDMFDSTPAAGALGERAIPRETDDLVFVVDRAGRVIKINETAMETLDVRRTDPLGDPLSTVLGTTVEELTQTETVELETAVGKRRFDPQVSSFTDQHGRQLGSLLSLRDVSERELREQRLEVLNRVLRHNLRNRIDVIKSNAEAIRESDSEYAEAIRESADGLATLSSKARATDELVSRPARTSEDDLAAVVRELVDAETDPVVTLDLPDSAPLVTDWEALRDALESAIENALEHAEESVTVTVEETGDGYDIRVADDGPGIPESELASLDAGTETPLQHGTGLGLWKLKWGVTKLNGELSFDTSDGTTVHITVPDQSG